ncbi:TRAP transporter substrate-binding protein [Azoarcus sp. PA01]|nr:TRAP transporter substrate-binding protein [Azoarcus sp. PA01]
MKTRALLLPVLAAGAMAGALPAHAEIVLKVHHMLPPSSTAQTRLLGPWCAKIAAESAGELKCQIYPSMQLGGMPTQLFDQAKDGVADIVLTVPTYQAARFTVTEVFELPFMTSTAEKASRALWNYAAKYAAEEYKGVRPLAFHTHEGAQIHTTKKQVRTMADFAGLKLRAPSRLSTKLVAALGSTPVPMPVPQVPESLAKGVIDGALLPWEVMPGLKLDEIVKYHTETEASLPNIANTIFVLAMNPAKYESLPPELKKVIDANSGAETSAWIGRIWDETKAPNRKLAEARNNAFYTVPAAEVQHWIKASEGVALEWVKEVTAKGYDGDKLLADAKAMLMQ